MDTIEEFKDIISEIRTLLIRNVTAATPAFKAWHIRACRFMQKHYGENSIEYTSFVKQRFSPVSFPMNAPDSYFVNACRNGLKTTELVFQQYLSEMENDGNEISMEGKKETFSNSIFVVHGHNGEIKEGVARLIEKQGFQAIILNERANQGKTIIEKLEHYGDAGAAICLFSADDEGKAIDEEVIKKRARQNVVFEAGYFAGKLGRDRVIIIADEGIEIPSDLGGVVRLGRQNWEVDVLKDLRAMGFKINSDVLLG